MMWAVVRPFFWGVVWSLLAQNFVEHAWGWPWWAQAIVSIPAVGIAMEMTRHRSIMWRLAIIRCWDKMQRPLVIDEDGNLRGGMLPFEELHLTGDDDGPIEGHVHTRTLVLGRPKLRAQTRWRA